MKRDLPQKTRPGAIIIIFGILAFSFAMVSMLFASSEGNITASQNLQVQINSSNFLNSVGILAFGIIIAGAARVLYVKIWRDQF